MLRDPRTTALGALVTLALTTRALTRTRRRADPPTMTTPSAVQQRITQAIEDLRPGALVAFNALPAGGRLVEVIDFDPDRPLTALRALDVKHEDLAARSTVEVTLTLGQVVRSYTVVQYAPHVSVPNTLSDADVDLLRTRVDQRG